MNIYKKLATIDLLLDTEHAVEYKGEQELGPHIENVRKAAENLVFAADDRSNLGETALHAKNLADRLNQYLQLFGQVEKISLRNLGVNTRNLTTRDGRTVEDRFTETHDNNGVVAQIRNNYGHGDYVGVNGLCPTDFAEQYLDMVIDCLKSVHPSDEEGSIRKAWSYFSKTDKMVKMGGLATATALAIYGVVALNNLGNLHDGAQERVAKNKIFLKYASEQTIEAEECAEAESASGQLPVPNMAYLELARQYSMASDRLEQITHEEGCRKTSFDFYNWLERSEDEDYATHKCLDFWADDS